MAERPGGQPTEEPTPRRLADARRWGQVAHSRELDGAAAFAAAFMVTAATGGAILTGLVVYMAGAFAGAASAPPPAAVAHGAFSAFARALGWPLGAAFAAALGVGFLQTRGLLTFAPLRPDLRRLFPASVVRRLIGGPALADSGLGLFKLAAVAAVTAVTLRSFVPQLLHLSGASSERALAAFGVLGRTLGLRLVLVALALGGLDYLVQRRRHRRGLRMTRDEVRREAKELEGDPRHRVERQRLHRQVVEQRLISEVRNADFVVADGDRIAVAVRYDRGGHRAPVVAAKGDLLVAVRINEEARRAGVPVLRDAALARSLREIGEGDEIPDVAYDAVAEILRELHTAQAYRPGRALE